MDQTLFSVLLVGLIVSLGGWLGCRLLRQNDRFLLRLEALEERVAHLGAEAARPDAASGDVAKERRGNRSLADSKINRSGLSAGTPAPGFRLPRLDEGELSLEEFRGRQPVLVFSDPRCGPCSTLMPQLERQHRASSDVAVLMVSRGDREANRATAEEHGLTFPIVLQRQWEISRAYGIFATPVACLDEQGILASDVAVGTEAILALLSAADRRSPSTVQSAPTRAHGAPTAQGEPQTAHGSLATLAIALARGLPRREALRQFGLALASALLTSLGVRNAWSQANPCATLCEEFTGTTKLQRCLAGCNNCFQQGHTPCGTSPSGMVICVDLLSDVQNCGSCGNRCPEGHECVEGKCLPKPICPKESPFYDPVRNVCMECRDQSDCSPNDQCCSGDCVPLDAVCCGTILCPGPFRFCVEPNLCCTDPTDPKGTICTSHGIKLTSLRPPKHVN